MLKEFNTIGVLYSALTTVDELTKTVERFLSETNADLLNKELVLCTIDTESAQKYGLFESLSKSELLASLSKKPLNFYYEYDDGALPSLRELINYVKSANGCVVILGPKDPYLTDIVKYAHDIDFNNLFSFD